MIYQLKGVLKGLMKNSKVLKAPKMNNIFSLIAKINLVIQNRNNL